MNSKFQKTFMVLRFDLYITCPLFISGPRSSYPSSTLNRPPCPFEWAEKKIIFNHGLTVLNRPHPESIDRSYFGWAVSRLKVVLEGDAASLPRRARQKYKPDDIMTLFDSKLKSSRLNRII